MSIFTSEESFWDAYRCKLALLLREEENAPDFGLGAFVLVCANAYFNSGVLNVLEPDGYLMIGMLRTFWFF
jgi:hypothetical protein